MQCLHDINYCIKSLTIKYQQKVNTLFNRFSIWTLSCCPLHSFFLYINNTVQLFNHFTKKSFIVYNKAGASTLTQRQTYQDDFTLHTHGSHIFFIKSIYFVLSNYYYLAEFSVFCCLLRM